MYPHSKLNGSLFTPCTSPFRMAFRKTSEETSHHQFNSLTQWTESLTNPFFLPSWFKFIKTCKSFSAKRSKWIILFLYVLNNYVSSSVIAATNWTRTELQPRDDKRFADSFLNQFFNNSELCGNESDFPSLVVLWFAERHCNQSPKEFELTNHVLDIVI